MSDTQSPKPRGPSNQFYVDGTKLIIRRKDAPDQSAELAGLQPELQARLVIEGAVALAIKGVKLSDIITGQFTTDRVLPAPKLTEPQKRAAAMVDVVGHVWGLAEVERHKKGGSLPRVPAERKTAIDNIVANAAAYVRLEAAANSAWYQRVVVTAEVVAEAARRTGQGSIADLLEPPGSMPEPDAPVTLAQAAE